MSHHKIDGNRQKNDPINGQTDGVKNWLIFMVSILLAAQFCDSLKRHGMIKDPLEILLLLVDVALDHRQLYCVTFLCFLQQIAQTYAIEKSLSLNFVSERTGMIAHALNVFFLPTSFAIFARLSRANPLVSRQIAVYIMYVMTKTWSYAYVNSQSRRAWRQRRNATATKDDVRTYPENVTVANIVSYMIFTPPIQYKPIRSDVAKRTPPDWRKLATLCCQQFVVLYLTALIFFQVCCPIVVPLRGRGGGEIGLIAILTCLLKLAAPFQVLWLLFSYVNTYRIYLPAYGALTGRNDVVFSTDWWNSHNTTVFWRKWNIPVHECLKYNVAVPLIQNGYSRTFATVVAFLFAGVLHEYLNSSPLGVYNGSSLLITMLEIPWGHLSAYVANKFGHRYGNLVVWIYLFSTHIGGIGYFVLTVPPYAMERQLQIVI